MKELKLNEYLNSYPMDYVFPVGTLVGTDNSWKEYEVQANNEWKDLRYGHCYTRGNFIDSHKYKITLFPKEPMADQIKVGMLVKDCQALIIPIGTLSESQFNEKWQFQADKLWHQGTSSGWDIKGYHTRDFGSQKITSIPNETPAVKELKIGIPITDYPAGYKFPQGTAIFDGYGKYTYNHGVWLGNNGAEHGKDAFQRCWKIHSWPGMKTTEIPAETSTYEQKPKVDDKVGNFPKSFRWADGTQCTYNSKVYTHENGLWRSCSVADYTYDHVVSCIISHIPTATTSITFRCIACGKNRQARYLSTTANTCNYCFKEPTKDNMTATSTAISPFSATFNMVLEAGASGAKAGAAAELCDFMVEGVRKTFHENLYVQAALGNAVGNWIARLLLPIILYFLASWAPKAALGPVDAESIKKVCYYAHQGNMTLVVGPITARLTPFLKSLAGRVGDLAD